MCLCPLSLPDLGSIYVIRMNPVHVRVLCLQHQMYEAYASLFVLKFMISSSQRGWQNINHVHNPDSANKVRLTSQSLAGTKSFSYAFSFLHVENKITYFGGANFGGFYFVSGNVQRINIQEKKREVIHTCKHPRVLRLVKLIYTSCSVITELNNIRHACD